MILSVSRRTDMPALYSDWFLKRLEEGFVYVRNPMSLHVVSKIDLSKEAIDCVVFWTKDPSKILGKIEQLDAYAVSYTHLTLPTKRIV